MIFDGLRQAFYPLSDDGRRNFVDLNTIPDAVVDRVEVLRDGASSTYGSDAIAGVVNIITKKEIRGVHLNASHGWSQHGGGAENRIDATVGFGDLANSGVNVYVSGEYQTTKKIWARQRGFPFNTGDWSSICNPVDNCGPNNNLNGINADGSFNGLFGTVSPLVRPYTNTPVPAALGPYQILGGSCVPGETLVTGTGNATAPQACELDSVARYQQNQPDQTRIGLFSRATVRIGDRAEGFLQGTYYEVKTKASFLGLGNTDRTAAGDVRVGFSPFFLPVYVCPIGTPYQAGSQTAFACNGNPALGAVTPGALLNPNNPFAAQGQIARWVGRYDRPRTVDLDSRAYRVAAGINGDFGTDLSPFHYNVAATYSRIDLTLKQFNYLNVRHMIIAANAGLYDFLHPENNTQAQRDFIAPPNTTDSYSTNFEVDATLSKEVFQLPGGAFGAAIGVQFRRETLNNPSANPANPADIYDRYSGVNAVGAIGRRDVKSGYFELDAPILSLANNGFGLEANLSGRYDKYSSGQKNFSPKLGVKVTPVRELALRGTSRRASASPASTRRSACRPPVSSARRSDLFEPDLRCLLRIPQPWLLPARNPRLDVGRQPASKPEKSTDRSRLGLIFEPIRNLSFTVDLWNIKVKNLIIGTTPSHHAARSGPVLCGQRVIERPGRAPSSRARPTRRSGLRCRKSQLRVQGRSQNANQLNRQRRRLRHGLASSSSSAACAGRARSRPPTSTGT